MTTFTSTYAPESKYFQPPRQGDSYDPNIAIPGSIIRWDDSLGTGCRRLARLAWRIRHIEAKRFGVSVMQISWLRCLLIAALIHGKRNNMNIDTIRQRVSMKHGPLIWS